MVLLRELISFEESTAKKDYHTLVNLLVGGPSNNPKAQFDKTHIFILFGSQDLVSIACEIWA